MLPAKFFGAAAAFVGLAALASGAAAQTVIRNHEGHVVPPALQRVANAGTKLTLIGTVDGLQVWFGLKQQAKEIFLVSPSGSHAIPGWAFARDGQDSITPLIERAAADGRLDIAKVADRLPAGSPAADAPPALVDPVRQGAATIGFVPPAAGAKAAAPSGAAGQVSSVTAQPVHPAVAPPGSMVIDEAQAPDVMYQLAFQTAWLEYGLRNSQAPVVYATMDPACKPSVEAWRAANQLAEAGKIRLRVIPVAIISEAYSRPYLAKILASGDPVKAWADHASGRRPSQLADGQTMARDDINQVMKLNHTYVATFNLTQTPTLIYRDPKTGQAKVTMGASPDDLRQVTGG